ncbi:ABC transporter type 1, transmembrane domain [Sesbania bispinosa]|nr:ABC transporter type 1, transmembrane domain [Sesbania bispinosa]
MWGGVVVIIGKDSPQIKSQIRLYSSIFCCIAVVIFISGLLQHYNFAIMGERLLKRVREFLLEKISVTATQAFVLGLIVSWRVTIIMIGMQPLIIACLYSKCILMKSMSSKARSAQREGSQLAMEATINHRTIAAFSSEKRMLNLFTTAMEGPKKESIKQSWISGSILSVSQFITTSITLTFWYGGRLLNQGLVESKHLSQVFLILMGTEKKARPQEQCPRCNSTN